MSIAWPLLVLLFLFWVSLFASLWSFSFLLVVVARSTVSWREGMMLILLARCFRAVLLGIIRGQGKLKRLRLRY
jgi:hypothetical protein